MGNFRIVCESEDKIEFTGFGFQKKVIKLEKPQNNIKVKLIFKGGNKDIELAAENGHISKENLNNSIAYTYSEPITFYEYTYDSSVIARQAGIKNVMVSAGYINCQPLLKLCKVIDAANIDMKSFGNEIYLKLMPESSNQFSTRW